MKQRLVGTLVLGSLALIVIPLLLDGEGVERPPLSATIPPAPVFDTSPLPAPERPDILADDLAAATDTNDPALDAPPNITPDATPDASPDASPEIADASTGNAPTEAPAMPAAGADIEAAPADEVAGADAVPEAVSAQSSSTPALDASGLPEGWIVRLGAFSNRANADALVTRLIAAGHKAYIRPVMSGDVALSGVFVGPVPTRNEAATLQTELKSRFRIDDAIVQRYDIAQ